MQPAFPALQILDPGFLTSVQDPGRWGWQQYGVSPGGALDPLALRAANRLVGNAEDAAALEITLAGPRLAVLRRSLVAVTGARFELHVFDRPLPMNAALLLRGGETLEFGARESGAYAYLAIAGGIDVPPVLGSRATDLRGGFGGYKGRALRVGDVLGVRAAREDTSRAATMLPETLALYQEDYSPIRFIWGPHAEYLSDEARSVLTASEYRVTELSDRMGLRLDGPALARRGGELLSCGVTTGAIQLPPDGRPIVLLADHQTTGGYPVIATVIRADIPRLVQRPPGSMLSFRNVGVEEALAAAAELERLLAAIK